MPRLSLVITASSRAFVSIALPRDEVSVPCGRIVWAAGNVSVVYSYLISVSWLEVSALAHQLERI
jgi:hypothetical protein